jgi:uncharacterized membrane protein YbhN (UPF0104 family)
MTVGAASLSSIARGAYRNRFLKSPRVEPLGKLTASFFSQQTSNTVTMRRRVVGTTLGEALRRQACKRPVLLLFFYGRWISFAG